MHEPDASGAARTVFLFPGQGSQHHQMAREIFEHEPDFREHLLSLDWDYSRREGQSLLDSLFGLPARVPLDDIRVSHPLLVMLEYALATTLMQRGLRPGLLLASSVGEFAAHAFAGRMSIERALEMVTHQARCALRWVEEGFLAAVMDAPDFLTLEPEARTLAHLAGHTFPGAIVLAGRRTDWPALEALLRRRACTHQLLPVRVPFHSPLMDPMCAPWIEPFADDVMRPGWVPVLGQCPPPGPERSYAQALWHIIREPLDFPSLLQRLDRQQPMRFIDVGPAGTLAGWVRHGGGAGTAWQTVGLLSPWGGDRTRLRKACGGAATAASKVRA